jgi:hypothetical protein
MEIQLHALLPWTLDGASSRIHAATALPPRETSPYTHYTSVGGRSGLNNMSVRTGERKNLCPCGDSSPGLSSRRWSLCWLCSSIRLTLIRSVEWILKDVLSFAFKGEPTGLVGVLWHPGFFFPGGQNKDLNIHSPRELENLREKHAKAPYSICKIKMWFIRIIGLCMKSYLRNLCTHLFISSFSLYLRNEDLIICAMSNVIASILPWLNRRSRHVADIGNMRCEQIFFSETPRKMCGPG